MEIDVKPSGIQAVAAGNPLAPAMAQVGAKSVMAKRHLVGIAAPGVGKPCMAIAVKPPGAQPEAAGKRSVRAIRLVG